MKTVRMFGFDYKRQAWFDDGVYVSCGHSEFVQCGCYGRLHEGEPVEQDGVES